MIAARPVHYTLAVLLLVMACLFSGACTSGAGLRGYSGNTVKFEYDLDQRSDMFLNSSVASDAYLFLDASRNRLLKTEPFAIVRSENKSTAFVPVDNVPPEASDVISVYYGENGGIAGVGHNTVCWKKSGMNSGKALIDRPSFYPVSSNTFAALEPSCRKLGVGDAVKLKVCVTVGSSKENIDIVDFVSIEGVDDRILAKGKDSCDLTKSKISAGYYKGAAKGCCSGIYALAPLDSGASLRVAMSGSIIVSQDFDKVIFAYTDIGSQNADYTSVAGVRFNFIDSKKRSIYHTERLNFSASGGNTLYLTVTGVPSSAVRAAALYYDSSGKVIRSGIEDLYWGDDSDSSDMRCTVENPEMQPVDTSGSLKLSADNYAPAVGSFVRISAIFKANSSAEEVDITPFVDLMDLNTAVLSPAKDKGTVRSFVSPGFYKVISSGEVRPSASVAADIEKPVVRLSKAIRPASSENMRVNFECTHLTGIRSIDERIAYARLNFLNKKGDTKLAGGKIPVFDNGVTFETDTLSQDAASLHYVFFSEDGEMLAGGVSSLEQGEAGADGAVSISDPPITPAAEKKGKIKVSKYVIAPDEMTKITAFLVLDGSSSPLVNVTPFVKFENFNAAGADEEKYNPESTLGLVYGEDGKPVFGAYCGVQYGVIHGGRVVFDRVFAVSTDAFYVTDQIISSIRVVPDDIEGVSVYTSGGFSEPQGARSYLICVPDKKSDDGSVIVRKSMGRTYASVDCGTHIENVAVNSQPFRAFACYSDEPGRGPRPVDADITSDTSFQAEAEKASVSFSGNVLTVSSMNDAESENVSVKGRCGSSEGSCSVRCLEGKGRISLWNDENDTIGGVLPLPDTGSITFHFHLHGYFEIYDGRRLFSVPFDIPEDILPSDSYPDMVISLVEDDISVEGGYDDGYFLKLYSYSKENTCTLSVMEVTGLPKCTPAHFRLRHRGNADRTF